MTLEAAKASAPIPPGLPKALRPWSPVFEDMPEAHLRLIGGLMGQLNTLLEETFEIDAESYGEFNGYDGMALRGEIERLLPSEWLWKELAPDEFLRRFAERELLYHRPSFESPTDERTHLVIIESGRAMLGRPRIVALAALLCLNALARAQGAKLIWTAPLDNVGDWQPLLRQRDLQAFLLSANPLALKATDLESMVLAATGKDKEAELVLWTIGASPLAQPNPTIRTNQLVIRESMLLGPTGEPIAEATVRLRTHSGRQKEAVLAFPPEEQCVSILREPFRPPRVVGMAAPFHAPADGANPQWAPQELVVIPEAQRIVIRVAEGLLGLNMNLVGDLQPIGIRLQRDDHLLGLRWTHDKVFLALTRKYDTFSKLEIRKIGLYPRQSDTDWKGLEFRLEENEPVVINAHPATALPPLIKPGRKFRMIAVTANGEPYVLNRDGAERRGLLQHLPLIGMRGDWAFMLSGSADARCLVARNLATSHCMTFALPPDADVRSPDDVVHWPAIPEASSGMMLLARCGDGHWRGHMGKPHLTEFKQFPTKYIDIDLSPLGRAIPVGHYPGHRGTPPYPAFRACFWSPDDHAIHYCGFNLMGGVDIERLDVAGVDRPGAYASPTPGEPRMRIAMHKSSILSWGVDEQGHVNRIDGWYEVDRPSATQQKMRFHDIPSLMEKARWLSG